MRYHFFDTPEAASAKVAGVIVDQLRQDPTSVLGLPTGGSPLRVYAELRRAYSEKHVSFAHATTFNLDEYVGIGGYDRSSYAWYMRDALFDHVDCPPDQQHIPNGAARDPYVEAVDYEQRIAAAGRIDLLFLGIGRNAHIAFNEPGSSHASRTHVVTLADDTVSVNARFFTTRAEVPTRAITMGIATIVEAKRIVLLATGADKAEALLGSFMLEPSKDYPASALKTHPNCDIVVDAAAGRLLRAERDRSPITHRSEHSKGEAAR